MTCSFNLHLPNNSVRRLITKLGELKYTLMPDIRDRATLNLLDKSEALNSVHSMPGEAQRLLDEIVTADVFKAAQRLHGTDA